MTVPIRTRHVWNRPGGFPVQYLLRSQELQLQRILGPNVERQPSLVSLLRKTPSLRNMIDVMPR